MAQLGKVFDARSVDPSQVASQLPVSPPEGWPMVITSSEMKPTKDDANSGYLELSLQIIDGPHKGETGTDRLNLYNKSEQAANIAWRQLSAYCHVTGQFQVADSAQLHNIPFRGIVGLQKKKKEDDPDYTEVKGVLDINGNAPGKAAAAPAAAAPAAAPAPAPNPTPAPAANAAPPAAPAAWGAQPAAPAPAAPAEPAQPAWSQPPTDAPAVPPWGKK